MSMLEKHRVTIHGNTIEWDDGAPAEVENCDSVSGYLVLNEKEERSEPNGKKLMAILRKIADNGGIASIPDPVAWQREIRKDRPLPGRD